MDAERKRCMDVVLEEYQYWRDVENVELEQFSMGAMGAAANILARIIDSNRPKTGTEIKMEAANGTK